MMWLGLAVMLFGFVLSVASLGLASSVGARMTMVLLGIAVSLAGLIGLVNRAFVQKAIWRR